MNSSSKVFVVGLFGTLVIASSVAVSAQAPQTPQSKLRSPLTPPSVTLLAHTPLQDELFALTQQAGIIFAGQVLAIHGQTSLGSSVGRVEIEFRVEEAIRGCTGQGTYVLREWAGLWAGGLQRYRVGQRLLMLLHSPSASGLSSPVGGQDGAIPIAGSLAVSAPSITSATSLEQAIDVRWLETRLVRNPSQGDALHAKVSHARQSDTLRLAADDGVRSNGRFEAGRLTGRGLTPLSTAVAESVTPLAENGDTLSQGLTLRGVLSMLEAWEGQQANGAR